MKFVGRLTLATMVAVVSIGVTACAPALQEEQPDYSDVPTSCPDGFAGALGKALNSIQAVGEVDAATIGLGGMADKVACAIRLDSSSSGAFAVVVMRPEFSEDDVRRAAWDLDFDDALRSSMVRTSASKGEATQFLRQTYGSLSEALSDKGWNFRALFPPRTVVLTADLKIAHVLKKCESNGPGPYPDATATAVLPVPSSKVVSCRAWTYEEVGESIKRKVKRSVGGGESDRGWCEDVTSFDYDWGNDMLCHRPDGTKFYTDYDGAMNFEG